MRKKNDWYKRGGNEVVIFVPATLNSQLQRIYQKQIKRQGFKIKVVEKAGIAIKRLLQRSDPCKPRQCEREDCLVCRTDGKGPCVTNVPSVTTSTWEKHQEARIPEGRNTRSHLAIRKSDRPYGVQRFQMSVTGLYPNDAMLRQISEGVRIEKVSGDSLI